MLTFECQNVSRAWGCVKVLEGARVECNRSVAAVHISNTLLAPASLGASQVQEQAVCTPACSYTE